MNGLNPNCLNVSAISRMYRKGTYPWSFCLMMSFLSPVCLPSLPPSTTNLSIW
jgi:hypothetical protein